MACRYGFFLQSQVLAGQMRYETEFDMRCAVLCCVLPCRYDFFLQSQVLAGQMRYESEC
jgi:hypothetical protein